MLRCQVQVATVSVVDRTEDLSQASSEHSRDEENSLTAAVRRVASRRRVASLLRATVQCASPGACAETSDSRRLGGSSDSASEPENTDLNSSCNDHVCNAALAQDCPQPVWR